MAETDPFLISSRFWSLVHKRYQHISDYTRTRKSKSIKKTPGCKKIDVGLPSTEIIQIQDFEDN